LLGHSVKVLCHSVKVDGGCHRRGLVAACRLLCALNLRSAERCSVERSLGCPDLYHCSVAIDSQTRNPSLPSPSHPHQSHTSPVAQVLFPVCPYTRVGRQSGLLQQLLTARSAVVGYVAQPPARPYAWGLWACSRCRWWGQRCQARAGGLTELLARPVPFRVWSPTPSATPPPPTGLLPFHTDSLLLPTSGSARASHVSEKKFFAKSRGR